MSEEKKPGMLQMLQSAKTLKKNMEAMQEEIDNAEFTGEAGAGMVKITLNGHHEAKAGSVFIEQSIFSEKKHVLEDLIVSAINDAVQKLDDFAKEKLADVTKGLDLPKPPIIHDENP